MTEIVLQPCPICGKNPRIIRDRNYEAMAYGAWCTILCKPFLRKPHLIVESGKASWQRAYEEAAEWWNQEVDKYIESFYE